MTSRNSALTKAVILAAGRGTRMGSLTADIPKPMIPVAGKPILERILESLAGAGIRQFLLITGYRAEMVEEHFGDGKRWGVGITYVRQTVQDGTGRAVELGRQFAGADAFFLTCGDILVANTTYTAMIRNWSESDWNAILAVKLGEEIRHGGLEIFDNDFFLKDLAEKPTESEWLDLQARYPGLKPWYNSGVYIFSARIFDYTAKLKPSPRGEYELTDAIRQMAHDGLRLKGHVIEDLWIDVRDPAVLARAEEHFRR
jgi:NDP-sugar pyrophosphorylase family protein